MMPMEAFGFIGSACSIASLLVSSDLRATVDNVKRFLSEVPEKFRADLVSDEGIKFVALLVIDQDLLDDLTDDVKNGESEYRKCLRRSKMSQQRDACDKRAERRICETLNRIRDRNDGDLPTGYLGDRWRSYSCVRY